MTTLNDLLAAAEAAENELVELARDLVRIPTVNTGTMPTGDELPACRFLEHKLAGDGIAARTLVSAENRGNLVARLPGTGGGPTLLMMAHLDVVPVGDEGKWRHPPFSAELENGRIWGRGTADCKDLVAAETMAMIVLKRGGVRLRGDLLLAAAADEESGGAYGFGWLVRNAPETIRADFAVNEGSGAPPTRTPRGLVQTLVVGEKGRLELHIHLAGASGHAAYPWLADNASLKLGRVLNRLQAFRPELDLSLPFFAGLPDLLGTAVTAENLDALADGVQATDPGLATAMRGLSRLTIVPTMVSGGVKSNSIPDLCTLVCDVRVLPQHDEAYVRRHVEELLAGIDGASYELSWTARPSASPHDTAFTGALRRATEQAMGSGPMTWLPALTPGYTDSRFLRAAGTPAYAIGSGHLGTDPTVPVNMHGIDESVDVASLLFRTKTLLALAWDVLGG